MIARLFLCLLALSLSACSSLSSQELIDLGEAQELVARKFYHDNDKQPAIENYLQAEAHYFEGLQKAIAEADSLWISFLRLKVAICRERVGILMRPEDGAKTKTWIIAEKCFAAGAAIAGDGGFLQMQANCLIQQASCARPDLNPDGDWVRAFMLYKQGADLCRRVNELVKKLDKKWLGEALYGQAVSALRGHSPEMAPEPVINLLTEARELGHAKAAELLAQSGSVFCPNCGRKIGGHYCDGCGTKKPGS